MSSPEIFDDVEQGSERWFRLRAGLPTASCANVVRAKKGPRGGTSHKEYVGRTTYLRKLAAERILGQPTDTYCGPDMQRGKEREAEGASLYGMLLDVRPQRVGFIRNGNCGASPDRTIGPEGLLEIKDAAPHIQIERLDEKKIPTGDEWQCVMQLLVSGRKWVDWMSHCRGLPPVILRIERDEAVIASLRVDVDQFVSDLDELVERIRSM